ncbi:MAG: HAD hydrolase-like protein [Bacteroidota bacterium]
MNIIFDLDGTLINSKPRLYNLFQLLVPESQLTFDEYWQLKKAKISHNQILKNRFNYSTEQLNLFNISWMNKIEDKSFLVFDIPFKGVSSMLNYLKETHNLYLVTARQKEESVKDQMTVFGWQGFFKKVLVTQQKQEKYDLILNNIEINPSDFIVGDTGKDIETGKSLGIKTIAVLSGFLSNESLLKYEPNYIFEDVTEINLFT